MAHAVPRVGAILSFIGGIFILLGGLVFAVFGAILSVFNSTLGHLLYLGIPIALLILLFSVLLFVLPQLRVAWGSLIVLLAFLSLVFDFFGGFVIGFLLCVIGGFMAVLSRDRRPASGWMGPPRCPACGGPVDITKRVCTQCGKPL